VGAAVYCSSSQAVKRQYRHDRPKPGLFRVRMGTEIHLTVTSEMVEAVGKAEGGIEVRRQITGAFTPARDPAAMEQAARSAFEKLGDTGLSLALFTCDNPAGLFVPVSRLNALRREV